MGLLTTKLYWPKKALKSHEGAWENGLLTSVSMAGFPTSSPADKQRWMLNRPAVTMAIKVCLYDWSGGCRDDYFTS